MEEWRDVIGCEGWYQVSSKGRVRSVDRVVTFSDGRLRKYKGRIISQYLGNGYPRVTLKMNGVDLRAHVHSLVAKAFLGPRPFAHDVLHGDGNRANNFVSNLRYGTRKDNSRDSITHGTHLRLAQRKFDNKIVQKIKKAQGLTYSQLAAAFGISRTHAFNIKNGLRRKD